MSKADTNAVWTRWGYRFKVHVGYTSSGRNRYRRFETLHEASKYCCKVFNECGNVLSIVKEKGA